MAAGAVPDLCSSASSAHFFSFPRSSSFLSFASPSSCLQPRRPRGTAGARTRLVSCSGGDRRRNVLVGLGGIFCATTGLIFPGLALGTPFPVEMTSAVSTVVKRPKKSRSKKEKEDEEEVLVVKGIEIDRNKLTKFDVYINSPDNAVIKTESAWFAGSFINLPHGVIQKKTFKSNLRLGLTDLLENINADDDDNIVVTLVPRRGRVRIDGVGIEFLNDDF